MLVHELVKAVRRVLAPRVGREQRVEVGQHVLDRVHRGGIRQLQRLPHPRELRIECFTLQHLLDRLVRRPRGVRVPVVARQRPDGTGRVVRHGRQLHLVPARRVGILARQGVPLESQRLVERGTDIVQRAAEVATTPRGRPQAPDPVGELVESPVPVHPATHQVAQRLLQRAAGEDLATQLVERAADVVRRCERVGTAPPRAVTEPAGGHRQAP